MNSIDCSIDGLPWFEAIPMLEAQRQDAYESASKYDTEMFAAAKKLLDDGGSGIALRRATAAQVVDFKGADLRLYTVVHDHDCPTGTRGNLSWFSDAFPTNPTERINFDLEASIYRAQELYELEFATRQAWLTEQALRQRIENALVKIAEETIDRHIQNGSDQVTFHQTFYINDRQWNLICETLRRNDGPQRPCSWSMQNHRLILPENQIGQFVFSPTKKG